MPASPGLAGMLNSYLSISFHLSVEICVDGLLILFIYGSFFLSAASRGWRVGAAMMHMHQDNGIVCNHLAPT